MAIVVALRCKKHQRPLGYADGGPYMVPRQNGDVTQDGEWELDLSDMDCSGMQEQGKELEAQGVADDVIWETVQCYSDWEITLVEWSK